MEPLAGSALQRLPHPQHRLFERALNDRWHTTAPYPSTLALQTPVGPDRFSYEVLPPGENHPDQATVDGFRGRLGATYDRPFFMAVGLLQPHPPWRIPQWAFDLHPIATVVLPPTAVGDLDDMPPMARALADAPLANYQAVQSAGTHELVVQAFLAAATHSDAMVGQVMNEPASSPFADTTNVVLWSDHGYHLGEHFHFRKSALWEQTTHVPFVISGPGIASGTFSRPVSLLDMAPTVVARAGAVAPADWGGLIAPRHHRNRGRQPAGAYPPCRPSSGPLANLALHQVQRCHRGAVRPGHGSTRVHQSGR